MGCFVSNIKGINEREVFFFFKFARLHDGDDFTTNYYHNPSGYSFLVQIRDFEGYCYLNLSGLITKFKYERITK